MSSWVTTLMASPGTTAFFCESSSEVKGNPMGEVGVKGSDPLKGLEGSGDLTGKGIDDGRLRSRGGGVTVGAGAGDGGMFEEVREPREDKGTESGGGAVGSEYGIGGATGAKIEPLIKHKRSRTRRRQDRGGSSA